ncbi:Rieske 2Fe-2S domain-containing protein [Legionella sp. W05-934-2]|jgi:phenylpropionate dioxygenase-like ring-hydroxylating dioxygenase large terminal subunit|uniref:Rieske 2Fe-2S domain-containing protein n=1 Tax=Legionella sp. W05-934-2 TaxID=1198649 RepID=UPI00346350EC
MHKADIYTHYPQGWFAVCFSSEIQPGQARARKLMGKEFLLWRDDAGNAHLQDAYCPHLGTHLGHCGKVIGQKIQCPFHGLTFDGQGKCSTTLKKMSQPHGKAVGLKTYPLVEQNGIIFSAFDSESTFAHWKMDPVDLSEYMPSRTAFFTLQSSPHEITENTLDLRHFSALHQYRGACLEYEANGQYLQVRTAIKRDGKLFGRSGLVNIETLTHHHGLGYANVHILVTELGIRFCGFVLPTPIDNRHIELRFQLQMKSMDNVKQVHPLLRFMPNRWANKLVFRQSFKGFLLNVAEDLPIWQTKTYLSEPALSELDGPIPFYRQWASQFYLPVDSQSKKACVKENYDYTT